MEAPLATRQKPGKLTALAVLIMGQVLPPAFMAGTLPAIFRQKGLALEDFWIFGLASMPYWFKWLWAPLIDRYGSHKERHFHPWILATTTLAAACYLGLGFVQPTVGTVALTCAVLVFCNLAMATQDIAVDGFIVQTTAPAERGAVSGAIGFGNQIGQLLASAGLVVVYDRLGWMATAAAAAVLLLVFTLPALARRPEPIAARPQTRGPLLAGLVELLRRRETPAIFALIFIFAVALFFIFGLQGAFLVDLGLSLTEIGVVSGVSQSVGFAAGALVSGWLISRLGLLGACRLGMLSWVVGLMPFVALAIYRPGVAATGAALLASALLTSPLFYIIAAARLGWTSAHQPATDYTAQSSVNAVGIAAGGASAAFVAAGLGWTSLFAVAAGLGVLAGAVFLLVAPRIERMIAKGGLGADRLATPSATGEAVA